MTNIKLSVGSSSGLNVVYKASRYSVRVKRLDMVIDFSLLTSDIPFTSPLHPIIHLTLVQFTSSAKQMAVKQKKMFK